MRIRHLLLSASALIASAQIALANPLGGSVPVNGGAATISNNADTKTLTINQTSDRAVINWQSFNIGPGETTRFVQPSGGVTLNRVTGNEGPSHILGTLLANGSVFLVNRNGVLVGRDATIDTGSFLATTHDISDSAFMAGGLLNFNVPGNPQASIVNKGTITVGDMGFAALVAPGVRNDGTITARLGSVALASAASGFTLDLWGDQLIRLQVGDAIADSITDVETGNTVLNSLVSNTGTLRADGGIVRLTAATARRAVDSVINNTGVIEANSVLSINGRIVLSAATAATKGLNDPAQNVKVSGTLRAAGQQSETRGGVVQIAGEHIALTGATVDVSGNLGGGHIGIGDVRLWNVNNLGSAYFYSATATSVTVDNHSLLQASATSRGIGGEVYIWSDSAALFQGTIRSTGLESGGIVEFASLNQAPVAGLNVDLSTGPGGWLGSLIFVSASPLTIDAAKAATIAEILNQSTKANLIVGSADTVNVTSSIIKTSGVDISLAIFAGKSLTVGPNVIIGSTTGSLSLWLESASHALFNSTTAYDRWFSVPEVVADGLAEADLKAGVTTARLNERLGQSLLEAADSVSPTVAASLRNTMFGDARSSINAGTLTIDPSARFYLNGGTWAATANNVTITNTFYLEASGTGSFVTNPYSNLSNGLQALASDPNYLQFIANCYASNTCVFVDSFSPTTGGWHAEVLGYQVTRNPATVSAGVVSYAAYSPSSPAPIVTSDLLTPTPIANPQPLQTPPANSEPTVTEQVQTQAAAITQPPPQQTRAAPPPAGSPPPGNGPPPRVYFPVAPDVRFVNNEVVLALSGRPSAAELAALSQRHRLQQVESQYYSLGNVTYVRWHVSDGRSVRDVVVDLGQNVTVAAVQPNQIFTLTQSEMASAPATHGDASQYLVEKLRLSQAHTIARGESVKVAVIDSGVDAAHPELAGVVAARFDAAKSEEGPHSHGTAIAGLIAAQARLQGTAPGAKILAARAFTMSGQTPESTTFGIIKSIEWAVENGARVINMSFAGPYDPAIQRALAGATQKNVVLVAAAGNAGPKSPPLYPAADPNVIAVSATDALDKLFPGSNRGKHIAIAAPGVDLLVAAPNGRYQTQTGTSFSAAEISGVVALLLERNGNLTPRDVRGILQKTAISLGPSMTQEQVGAGLVDAAQAVSAAAAPVMVSAVAQRPPKDQSRPNTVPLPTPRPRAISRN